jgi:hypothetical protein
MSQYSQCAWPKSTNRRWTDESVHGMGQAGLGVGMLSRLIASVAIDYRVSGVLRVARCAHTDIRHAIYPMVIGRRSNENP